MFINNYGVPVAYSMDSSAAVPVSDCLRKMMKARDLL